jgi:sRNA-binding protein
MTESDGLDRKPTTIILDRRESTPASASDEPVVLRTPQGREIIAKVTKESFSGIAVAVDATEFLVGDAIEVDYGGATMPAVVLHVDESADGVQLIGLRWQ